MKFEIFLLCICVASASAWSWPNPFELLKDLVTIAIDNNPVVRAVKTVVKGIIEQKSILEIAKDTAIQVVTPIRRLVIVAKSVSKGDFLGAVENLIDDVSPNLSAVKELIKGIAEGDATGGLAKAAAKKLAGGGLKGQLAAREIINQIENN